MNARSSSAAGTGGIALRRVGAAVYEPGGKGDAWFDLDPAFGHFHEDSLTSSIRRTRSRPGNRVRPAGRGGPVIGASVSGRARSGPKQRDRIADQESRRRVTQVRLLEGRVVAWLVADLVAVGALLVPRRGRFPASRPIVKPCRNVSASAMRGYRWSGLGSAESAKPRPGARARGRARRRAPTDGTGRSLSDIRICPVPGLHDPHRLRWLPTQRIEVARTPSRYRSASCSERSSRALSSE